MVYVCDVNDERLPSIIRFGHAGRRYNLAVSFKARTSSMKDSETNALGRWFFTAMI